MHLSWTVATVFPFIFFEVSPEKEHFENIYPARDETLVSPPILPIP